jgi:hypothetical protein
MASLKRSPYSKSADEDLMAELWSPALTDDLLAFVMFAYPWGKANTPLEHYKGPRRWQQQALDELSQHIANNKLAQELGKAPTTYKGAWSAGRGPGKSALFSWLTHWNMTTNVGSTTIATANTGGQLQSKTWPELGKWHTLAINSHWFERTSEKLLPAEWFGALVKNQLKIDIGYYYAWAQLWSEENPDAFAGAHNPHGMMVMFDEASNIAAPIWTISRGFFTEPVLHRYWLAFGNPRRASGSFFDCFHRDRNEWSTHTIDARTVEGTDPAEYQAIIDKFGEDSDQARVEVLGQFPHRGDRQFIASGLVEEAQKRDAVYDPGAPLIMGVDPARFGDDATVIRYRQGREARAGKVPPPTRMKGADNMKVANEVAHQIDKYHPDAVCVDAGNGTGVIDRLREMGYKVHEVWFGASSDAPEYANRRTQLWGDMRDWLAGAAIDADQRLRDDLTGPEYDFVGRDGDKMGLEPKERMKKRGLASPDDGDALACTFAIRVARTDSKLARGGKNRKRAAGVDERPFGY